MKRRHARLMNGQEMPPANRALNEWAHVPKRGAVIPRSFLAIDLAIAYGGYGTKDVHDFCSSDARNQWNQLDLPQAEDLTRDWMSLRVFCQGNRIRPGLRWMIVERSSGD
jgi:hypothetical protein